LDAKSPSGGQYCKRFCNDGDGARLLQARVAAFRKGLHNLGWAEGHNIRIDIRWATTDAASMQGFAKELVALQPDLILSHNTPTTAALLYTSRAVKPS
jgi:putative tryptophan/tyrosine transport system substrate-binding protein